MSQPRKLLFLTHPEQHDSPGLQRALALASACNAALHVLVYVGPFATFLLDRKVMEQARESLVQAQRKAWEGECAALRGRGLEVTASVVAADNLREEMLQDIRELQPDMVIKDVRHESALKRSFVTPLDWHLLRECPAPLLLVNDIRQPMPRKIVAAVDPSDPQTQLSDINDRIIAAANGLALQCDAELHLLFVYDCMPAYMANGGEGGVAWVDLVEEMRGALHKPFVALADKYGVPEERRHFLMGTAVRGIANFVQQNAIDVTVMGRIHRRAVDRLIGSTTEHLIEHVQGSVLALQPGEQGA
ncbi:MULTISPECIES: universal stress protein [Pseudomonas]|uniref:universal stress protein n=1 Tax=Pseudomonas TaxID=286 RepID=UPI00072FBC3D|nr:MULTISPECIES: universal stress protein [Pseudomonas]KSW22135.1 universal stress protein [Pseudomonas sp. ADP]MBH3432126.1 universal stress protein [Pseudomonas citronellolis]OBP10418.1 universal stress protein [Pseudomonas sp. EGD-AKN5]QOF84923.1 universal stress protein [Pseudomonas sp. ADPe]